MSTYDTMRNSYLANKEEWQEKENIAKEAKRKAAESRNEFMAWCRSQLKKCEKAGLLTRTDTDIKANHYNINQTPITLVVNSGDDEIIIFDYNRPNWFACELCDIQTHNDHNGNPIWSNLSDIERKRILEVISAIG